MKKEKRKIAQSTQKERKTQKRCHETLKKTTIQV